MALKFVVGFFLIMTVCSFTANALLDNHFDPRFQTREEFDAEIQDMLNSSKSLAMFSLSWSSSSSSWVTSLSEIQTFFETFFEPLSEKDFMLFKGGDDDDDNNHNGNNRSRTPTRTPWSMYYSSVY